MISAMPILYSLWLLEPLSKNDDSDILKVHTFHGSACGLDPLGGAVDVVLRRRLPQSLDHCGHTARCMPVLVGAVPSQEESLRKHLVEEEKKELAGRFPPR